MTLEKIDVVRLAYAMSRVDRDDFDCVKAAQSFKRGSLSADEQEFFELLQSLKHCEAVNGQCNPNCPLCNPTCCCEMYAIYKECV